MSFLGKGELRMGLDEVIYFPLGKYLDKRCTLSTQLCLDTELRAISRGCFHCRKELQMSFETEMCFPYRSMFR